MGCIQSCLDYINSISEYRIEKREVQPNEGNIGDNTGESNTTKINAKIIYKQNK
jgi:hypothetical protein